MTLQLPTPEFEEERIWDKLYEAELDQLAKGLKENSWTEGEDGEAEFDRRVLASARGKDVIDIGCGTGEFALDIAAKAKTIVGIDFSKRALRKAMENLQSKKLGNVKFEVALANNLPYPDSSFDLAICRRGPATDTLESLSEAYRVLRPGGRFMAQDIGESDKQNLAEAFGRGEIYESSGKVREDLEKRLAHVGFRDIVVEEFRANEYFATVQDLIMRIENSPIIPDFDRGTDEHHLREILRQFSTPKGIKTNTHRVLVAATKLGTLVKRESHSA